jgi:potassium-dependent mechanosensitive channel
VKSLPAPAILLLALLAWQHAPAQLPSLGKLAGGKTEAAAPEKPDDLRNRLELWQQEAKDLVKAMEAGGTAIALPDGVTAAELDDRRRNLEQIILLSSGWLKNFDMVAEAKKTAESARAAESAWTGFKEPPPYSILMIDELLNERDAIKAKIAAHQSSFDNFGRILTATLAEAKAAEEAENAAKLALREAGPANAEPAKWRLDAASANTRLLATRAGFLQTNCEALTERVTAGKADLTLVERKIRAAAPNSTLRDEDLAKIEKIATERKAAIGKELSDVSKRMKSALSTRAQAQAALDALPDKAATAGPDGADLARFRLTVAEQRVESLQSVTDSVESLIQLENIGLKAYQDRHTLIRSKDHAERGKSLESLAVMADRLKAWLNVLENDMSASGAELSKIESRAASISADDPRFPLVNEQRAARSEMLATLQRTSQAVEALRRLIRRWVTDHTPKREDITLGERATRAWTATRDGAGAVWNFKVLSFEDKVQVDGQNISVKVPVTLGMLLRAALFFLIGYWIASRIANRIQRTIISRGHIAEPQARTLRNWAMIVVGAFLMLGTLSFLKIPLTVFAFFGGALAIGIGFGTQTLIRNFISGIIVLAERKIRVGDILDVDGIVGTVTEVNTRSSIIRGADDIETMIPNSVFLENRVTNWTLSNTRIRRSVRLGVAHGTEPRPVMEILAESAGRHGLVLKDPAPFAVFDDFGENALVFTLYFWLDLRAGSNAMIVASDLRLMIDKRLQDTGIGIQQRDMRLTTDQPIDVRLTDAR